MNSHFHTQIVCRAVIDESQINMVQQEEEGCIDKAVTRASRARWTDDDGYFKMKNQNQNFQNDFKHL